MLTESSMEMIGPTWHEVQYFRPIKTMLIVTCGWGSTRKKDIASAYPLSLNA
jgi:hypothetical protein